MSKRKRFLNISSQIPSHNHGGSQPTPTAICHHPNHTISTLFIATSTTTPTAQVDGVAENTTPHRSSTSASSQPRAHGDPLIIAEYDTQTGAKISTLIVPEATVPWRSDATNQLDYITQIVTSSTKHFRHSYLVAIGASGWAWVWSLPAREDIHLSPNYLGKRHLSPVSPMSILACGSHNQSHSMLYYSVGRTGDVEAWELDTKEKDGKDESDGGGDDGNGSGGSGGGMMDGNGFSSSSGIGGEDVQSNQKGPRIEDGIYIDPSLPVYRATTTLHKRTHGHSSTSDETVFVQHQEPEESSHVITSMTSHATLSLVAITHADGSLRVLRINSDLIGADGAKGQSSQSTSNSTAHSHSNEIHFSISDIKGTIHLSEARETLCSEPKREQIDLLETLNHGKCMNEALVEVTTLETEYVKSDAGAM